MKRPLADKRPLGPLLGTGAEPKTYGQIEESEFDKLQRDKKRVKQLTLEAHQQIDKLSLMSMKDLWKIKEDDLLDMFLISAIHGECNTLVAVPFRILPGLGGNVQGYAETVPSIDDPIRVSEKSAQATFPFSDYFQAIAKETGCGEAYDERMELEGRDIIRKLMQDHIPDYVGKRRFNSLAAWREYYDDFPMDEVEY